MDDLILYLREFNIVSVTLRLCLAMFCGGCIGLDRGRKRRAAGFRTYMLVCMGAALAMILSQYEMTMLETTWADVANLVGIRTDVSRFGAQVINGIGFLGAGTVIVTSKQEVKGLTTAAALWASACMGLAIGAGFYECMILAFILIFFCIRILPYAESFIIENAKNMNVYIEFDSLDHIGAILTCLKQQDVHIHEVEIQRGREERFRSPSAVFALRLNRKISHAQLMSSVMDLEYVRSIEEI